MPSFDSIVPAFISLGHELVIPEFYDSKGCTFLSEELPDIDSFNESHPYFDDDPLSGSTTYSANSLLEEFADELALISYPPDYDDNRVCDIEGGEIKEAELLIDLLDLPCDVLSEYDSFNSQDFSRDDVLFSPDNEDKVFNPGIISHEKSVKIITRVSQEKKLAVSFASWFFCFQSQSDFHKPDEDLSCSKWKEYSSLGCSSVPFLSPLIRSSMGGFWSSSFDLKQALLGRHPMLIFLGFFFLLGYASSVCSCLVYVFGNPLFVCFVLISCPVFPDL
nr:hypothetical protein [Tanacetum cinerariifolium]